MKDGRGGRGAEREMEERRGGDDEGKRGRLVMEERGGGDERWEERGGGD
jgi:hypothetical protein